MGKMNFDSGSVRVLKRRLAILLIGPILVLSGALPSLGNHPPSTIDFSPASCTGQTIDGGQTAVYTVDVINDGNAGDVSLAVSDSDAANFTSTVHDGAGDPVTQLTMSGHDAVTLTIRVTATAGAPFTATNDTILLATRTDDATVTNSFTCTTTIADGAGMTLAKSADDPTPRVGQEVTFTIDYTNPHGQTVTAFSVTDLVDGRLTIGAIGGGGGSSGQLITWPVGDVSPGATGSVTFTAFVEVVPDGTSISNVAGGDGSNVEASASNSVTLIVEAPAMSSLKEVTAATAYPSATLTYTISYRNSGSAPLTSFSITDDVDTNLTVTSISNGGSESGGTITWNLADVPADGVTRTVTFSATVNAVPDGTTISNQATLDGAEIDPQDTNQTITTINSLADLSIVKADSPDPVRAGEQLVFTLEVSNAGPNDNSGFTVTDTLPSGISAISAPGCTVSLPVVVCNSGGIASGSTQTFTITGTVDPATPTGTVLANAAEVRSTGTTDPDTSSNTASSSTLVFAEADLGLSKTASPDPVTAGTNLTFTLDVENFGPSAAGAYEVGDFLPAGTSFVSATSPACTFASGTVTCSSGGLAVGASDAFTIVVRVDSDQAAGITILNGAQIASSATQDPNTSNNIASDTALVVASADLSIVKVDSPDPVLAGTQLVFTIEVANAGPSDNAGYSVTDTLPPGTSLVSAPGCSELLGVLTCSSSGLAAGGIVTYTVTTLVDPGVASGTVLSNTAVIALNPTSDPDASDDSSTTTTLVLADADLSVVKTDTPDPAEPNQSISYTISVTNNGPSDNNGFTLTDTLPADVTFVSASSGCSLSGSAVECISAGLDAGSAVTWTVIVTVDPGVSDQSVLVNDAAITSNSTSDSNPANDFASEETTVKAPILVLTKSSIPLPGSDVSPGQTVTFTVTYENQGLGTARNFFITDTVSPLLGSITLSAGGTVDTGSNTVTWTVGDLAPGVTGTVTLTARIGASPNPSTIENFAGGMADELAAPVLSNEIMLSLRLPDVVIRKSADRPEGSTVKAFDQITYFLEIENRDQRGFALGVVVTDVLPPYVTYVPGSTTIDGASISDVSGASPLFAGGLSLGSLSPGDSSTVTFRVQVDATARAGSPLENWTYVDWAANSLGLIGDFHRLSVFSPNTAPELRQSIVVRGPDGEIIFVTVFNDVLGRALGVLPLTGMELAAALILALSAIGAGRSLSMRIKRGGPSDPS